MKLDPFTQKKAHGQVVDALPAGGQARFDGHVLGIADQRIEDPVGKLQHAAGKLHVGVEGYRVGIQSHLQGGGTGKGSEAEKHG